MIFTSEEVHFRYFSNKEEIEIQQNKRTTQKHQGLPS